MTAPTPIIDRDRIGTRVAEIAAEVDATYAGTEELVLLGVLKGSFVFLADLARHLTVPHRVEFIAVSSYGEDERTQHTGAVRMIMDVRHDVADQDVLVVEDIVDTGHTLSYLQRLLAARRPKSLRTVTLLRKPDRAEVDVAVDWIGFDIPDVWVVGYGLDWLERFRTLPDICEIEPEG
ncbi:MAG TPA: hypoxanthine phosphoribosyltransferase [Acidimicrobiia bacterium]|nr:hypoxanthine phosphoribosyltransferase [Acidimicrobiia bacterium]